MVSSSCQSAVATVLNSGLSANSTRARTLSADSLLSIIVQDARGDRELELRSYICDALQIDKGIHRSAIRVFSTSYLHTPSRISTHLRTITLDMAGLSYQTRTTSSRPYRVGYPTGMSPQRIRHQQHYRGDLPIDRVKSSLRTRTCRIGGGAIPGVRRRGRLRSGPPASCRGSCSAR